MAGDDEEDKTIQELVGAAKGFQSSWQGDPNAQPPDGSSQGHWPQHSYTKFLEYVQQAQMDLSGAVNNVQIQGQSASLQASAQSGVSAMNVLMGHITDIANHIEVAGSHVTAIDAATAYAATLKAAKMAIVAMQKEANDGYKGGGSLMMGAQMNHNNPTETGGCGGSGAVYQCGQKCGGAGLSQQWQDTLKGFNQFCEGQVQAVEAARQAMLRALDGVATGGQGGQAAAQAAQSGSSMGGMGGMGGMMSQMMQGVAQALGVPASMISNLAQQGPQMLAGLIGEAISAGAQGGGAAPTSAQEKDDVTVVKKQGPKLGEFITNQKKPLTPVVSTGTSGGAGAGGTAKPTAAAKPIMRAKPKLKVNFDPDAATGWGTTAASADRNGVGQGEEKERVARVPFRSGIRHQ